MGGVGLRRASGDPGLSPVHAPARGRDPGPARPGRAAAHGHDPVDRGHGRGGHGLSRVVGVRPRALVPVRFAGGRAS